MNIYTARDTAMENLRCPSSTDMWHYWRGRYQALDAIINGDITVPGFNVQKLIDKDTTTDIQ